MTDQTLTQKDLDLIDRTPATEDTTTAPADGGASADKAPADSKADAKPADKPAAKGGSLFDGLDDGADDGDDKPKGKVEAKPAAKDGADTGDDKKPDGDAKDDDALKEGETEEQRRERLAADAQWRDRIADKLLAPLKDKLSAKKFEQRREQIINQLKRSKSIDDAIVSGIQAQEKLRSGEHKKLPDDPDAAAAWRKENNVPETPDKYEIPTIPGHTWSDADKPQIDSFRSVAHANNLPQSVVNALVDWQVKDQQRVAEEMDQRLKQADAEDRDACYDQIRSEFGVREFKPHMAAMKRLIEDEDVFGAAGAEKIMSARFYDEESGTWRRLTSLPGVARGLIGLALDRYGDVSMPSGDGTSKGGKTRLDEINEIMAKDWDRYHREGLADEALKIQQDIEAKASRRSARAAR